MILGQCQYFSLIFILLEILVVFNPSAFLCWHFCNFFSHLNNSAFIQSVSNRFTNFFLPVNSFYQNFSNIFSPKIGLFIIIIFFFFFFFFFLAWSAIPFQLYQHSHCCFAGTVFSSLSCNFKRIHPQPASGWFGS